MRSWESRVPSTSPQTAGFKGRSAGFSIYTHTANLKIIYTSEDIVLRYIKEIYIPSKRFKCQQILAEPIVVQAGPFDVNHFIHFNFR